MRFIDHVDCINVTYSPDMIAKAFSSLARTRYAVFLCAGSGYKLGPEALLGPAMRESALSNQRETTVLV